MYINDTSIIIYLIFALMGFGMGLFVGWCNERLPEYKKIFSKDIFLEYKTKLRPSYVLGFINAILYVLLLYKFGVNHNIVVTLIFIQYLILIPFLLSTIVIDYRLKIIPNRLNLTLFEIGLLVCFGYGLLNFNLALDAIYGMLVGGGIFLLINVIGGLIAGKEAMGMGDVKLMGALGLFFGLINTIAITVLSFLVGAVISIVVLLLKKNEDGYIPFGPFIVIATLMVMFIPSDILINTLMKIFSLGLYQGVL